MPRDLGDLSAKDWEEVETFVREKNARISDETVLIRSHVYPQSDGTVDWLVFVPLTLHRARGTSQSLPDAYQHMDDQVRAWYPELTAPDGVDSWMTMIRLRTD